MAGFINKGSMLRYPCVFVLSKFLFGFIGNEDIILLSRKITFGQWLCELIVLEHGGSSSSIDLLLECLRSTKLVMAIVPFCDLVIGILLDFLLMLLSIEFPMMLALPSS